MNHNEVYTDIRSFAEALSRLVSQKKGEAYQVKLQEVIKNNGILLQGLVILSEDMNVSPTIYLNSLWELYLEGVPLERIVEKILRRSGLKQEVFIHKLFHCL